MWQDLGVSEKRGHASCGMERGEVTDAPTCGDVAKEECVGGEPAEQPHSRTGPPEGVLFLVPLERSRRLVGAVEKQRLFAGCKLEGLVEEELIVHGRKVFLHEFLERDLAVSVARQEDEFGWLCVGRIRFGPFLDAPGGPPEGVPAVVRDDDASILEEFAEPANIPLAHGDAANGHEPHSREGANLQLERTRVKNFRGSRSTKELVHTDMALLGTVFAPEAPPRAGRTAFGGAPTRLVFMLLPILRT